MRQSLSGTVIGLLQTQIVKLSMTAIILPRQDNAFQKETAPGIKKHEQTPKKNKKSRLTAFS
jgi:hypothetical protein